jgi:hypothetical protein
MLSSIFGDRASEGPDSDPRWQTTRPEGEGPPGVSTIVPAEEAGAAAGAERHAHELFLTGSIGAALRTHLAGSSEPAIDSHAIALFDPVRMWAPALMKSLSDAGAQPVERLVLRDASRHTTLATLERTRAVRRFDETIKVYHADVPSGVADAAAVPVVLMERAQLAAVIVGPMHPESVTGMLEMLLAATHAPTWRCPNLLFMLPPAAVWIANKVSGLGWPLPLHLTVLNESLANTSAVWNALLGIWNHAKNVPHWSPPVAEAITENLTPIHVEAQASETITPLRLDIASHGEPAAPPAAPARLGVIDPQLAAMALEAFVASEGVLACALIDAGSGLAIASDARDPAAIDIGRLAAASTQLLRAHRHAARQSGSTDPVEEVIVGTRSRQQVIRLLARHPGLFLCAVLDANRGNLALTRYKLIEAERALV